MTHTFDTEIAEQYGLLESILLNHIYYWTEKNRANEMNFYDGNYWTYNSTRAFNELFPYVSEKQIRNALKHLREDGILLTGNYNKSSYDRTLWYALSKKGLSIVQKCQMEEDKEDLSIGQKCQMEETKEDNGLGSNVQPIPDNKPDIKPDNKPDNKPNNIISAQSPDGQDSGLQEEPFITLELNTGEEHPVYEEEIKKWEELYPAVDVRQQLRSMKGWLLANPAKRKTKRGINRFINGWLVKRQDRGGGGNPVSMGYQQASESGYGARLKELEDESRGDVGNG